MVNQTKGGWKQALITAFIIFHLYIIALWGLPGSTFRYYFCKPITDYVIYTGLWHSWDMFSPDPLAINFNVKAEITYQNGAVRTWTFPRMERLSIWQRFQKERYRKWRERVRLDMYSNVWDDTARYIARLNDMPNNHPVRIAMIREWQPIATPATLPQKSTFRDYQPMIGEPPFLFNYHFKFYDVKPDDLL